MSRWKKDDVLPHSLIMRVWLKSEQGLAYRKRHNEYVKEWRKKNKDKYKSTQRRAYEKSRKDCLIHYSSNPPSCACCGETEILFLQLDHIDGQGAKHRRAMQKELGYFPGGTVLPYWLKKNNYPDGIQVLCANCNYAKRVDKTCPHQKKVVI